MKSKFCPYCNKSIRCNNFNRHVVACKNSDRKQICFKVEEKYLQSNGKYRCPECSKEFSKNGISTHFWKKHTEDGRLHENPMKGKLSWNHGLSKETDYTVYQCAKTLTDKYDNKQIVSPMKGKHYDNETKKKFINNGGYRAKGGRGKKGWYRGYWCDSSWELAWIIYQLDHNVKFTRNNEGFEYEFEGEKHKYYPDFILEDETYVEIKGYVSKCFNAKRNFFKKKLIVLTFKEISKYINYVKNTYGNDFIKLYEMPV